MKKEEKKETKKEELEELQWNEERKKKEREKKEKIKSGGTWEAEEKKNIFLGVTYSCIFENVAIKHP